MRPLHISRNTAHSGCKPSSSVSSFTHSLQVFLPLPTQVTPATTTFLQADTQSSSLLRFYMPKPSQSTMPCHLSHASNIQKTVQDLTELLILQRHTSISPSYALLSQGYGESPPSLPMSQSHISTHSGHDLIDDAKIKNINSISSNQISLKKLRKK